MEGARTEAGSEREGCKGKQGGGGASSHASDAVRLSLCGMLPSAVVTHVAALSCAEASASLYPPVSR